MFRDHLEELMATYSSISLALPEAQRLLDLNSIRRDFERCIEMCKLLVGGAENSRLPSAVIDALATSIPIIYARPFNGGVRHRVSEIESHLEAAELDFHNRILAMRTKYAAHSINNMEQHHLRVWLNPEERGGRKINSVNVASNYLACLAGGDYRRLITICQKAVDWIDTETESESALVTDIVLELYTLDQLYSFDLETFSGGDLKDVHGGRSRHPVSERKGSEP